MYPQPDGTILEYGAIPHPITGNVTKYVECWEDIEPAIIDEEEMHKSCVLKCDNDNGKGMIIRVGGIVQGLLIREGEEGKEREICVMRIEWNTGSREWKKTVAIGAFPLPVVVVDREVGRGIKVGEKFQGGNGLEWVCVEVYDWS